MEGLLVRVQSTRTAPVSERALGLCCPFCKDSLAGDGGQHPFVECAACRTWFHEECFLENLGCMTMGCREARARGSVPPPPRPLVRARVVRGGQGAASHAADYFSLSGRAPTRPSSSRQLEDRLAVIHSFAFATIAMILAAAMTSRGKGIVPTAFVAAYVAYAVERWVRAKGPAPSRLSGFSQFVCILAGLFSGLVGLPLFFAGVLCLID